MGVAGSRRLSSAARQSKSLPTRRSPCWYIGKVQFAQPRTTADRRHDDRHRVGFLPWAAVALSPCGGARRARYRKSQAAHPIVKLPVDDTVQLVMIRARNSCKLLE